MKGIKMNIFKVAALFFILCSVGLTIGIQPVTAPAISNALSAKSNSRMIFPGDNEQAAYDWLKSADRNAQMGVLSVTNRRQLILSAGVYAGNLTADAEFVDVVELVQGSTTFTGSLTRTVIDAVIDIPSRRQSIIKTLGPPKRYIDEKIIEEALVLDNTFGWTRVGGYGTLVYDPNLSWVSTDANNINSVGVKVGSAWGLCGLTLTFAEPISLINKSFALQIYVPDGSNMNMFQLYLHPNTTNWYGNNKFWRRNLFSTPLAISQNRDGWYYATGVIDDKYVMAGGMDLNDVNAIEIHMLRTANTGVDYGFYLGGCIIYDSSEPNGVAVFGIDAPTSQTYYHLMQVLPKFKAMGVPITIGISPWAVDTGTYLTSSQVRRLAMEYPLAIYTGNTSTQSNNWQDKSLPDKYALVDFTHRFFENLGIQRSGAEIYFTSGTDGVTPFDKNVLFAKYASIINKPVTSGVQTFFDPSYYNTTYFVNASGGVLGADFYRFVETAKNGKGLFALRAHIANDLDKKALIFAAQEVQRLGLSVKTYEEVYTGK